MTENIKNAKKLTVNDDGLHAVDDEGNSKLILSIQEVRRLMLLANSSVSFNDELDESH